MNLNSFDAAVFDMDGTIIDSLGIWERIDYEFLEKKRGIKVPGDYVHNIAAMSFSEIANYTKTRFNLPDTPEELMQEWTDMAIYEYSHNVLMKPFVKVMIWQAIFDYLGDVDWDEEEEVSETESETAAE